MDEVIAEDLKNEDGGLEARIKPHVRLGQWFDRIVKRRGVEDFQELKPLPFYDIRKIIQKDNVDRVLSYESEAPASWRDFKGEYRTKGSLVGIEGLSMTRNEVELSGDEVLVASRISELIKQGLDRPIVALDLGGMFGLSWVRIAKFFEDEVRSGKLRMVVTNLNLRVDAEELDSSRLGESVGEEDYNFWRANHDLVSFINCSVDGLDSAQVEFQNGDGVGNEMLGEIDVLHERMSVSAHSLIPDEDRVSIRKQLSEYATWITDNIGHNQQRQIAEYLKENSETKLVASVLAKADPEYRDIGVTSRLVYQDYLRAFEVSNDLVLREGDVKKVDNMSVEGNSYRVGRGRSIYLAKKAQR